MKGVSRFASPSDSPGFLLWQVTNRWQRALRDALAPLGLTHVQFVVLATCSWLADEQPPTQRELAEMARSDEMMTSQTLRALERKGLVERRRDLSDARANRVVPTVAGRKLVRQAIRAAETADAEFFAPLGRAQGELTRALRMLAGVAER